MKAFWDNLNFDIENGQPVDEAYQVAGAAIRDDVRNVEDAIRAYDLQKALRLLEEMKMDY